MSGKRGPVEDIPLSIVVVGASGDLAKKKTYPALFSLLYNNLLPAKLNIIGYGRTKMTDDEFRNKALAKLTCRVGSAEECSSAMARFYDLCSYKHGQYDSADDFKQLRDAIEEFEGGSDANRLIYLAVPPEIFLPTLKSVTTVFGQKGAGKGWLRAIVEKPFGHDLPSFYKLKDAMNQLMRPEQVFRIDHFLGKELVQNLMVLRFANTLFEPSWNRHYIDSVQITFKEDFGVEGRGGYFESSGIIRDILQNHLLQMLCLVAMEAPVSMHADDVKAEKMKVLKAISTLHANDFVVGQYGRNADHPNLQGYKDEVGVPANSTTPTLAACALKVNTPRWHGVPFFLLAGKALDERKMELRVCFKKVAGGLFPSPSGLLDHNELIIRIQPDESIKLRFVNKTPGISGGIEERYMSLYVASNSDKSTTQKEHSAPANIGGLKINSAGNPTLTNVLYEQREVYDIPDAYEPLILDAIGGDDEFFISEGELQEAWRIFTPALHELEGNTNSCEIKSKNNGKCCEKVEIPQPFTYEYKSQWPAELNAVTKKFGLRWAEEVEREFRQITRQKKDAQRQSGSVKDSSINKYPLQH